MLGQPLRSLTWLRVTPLRDAAVGFCVVVAVVAGLHDVLEAAAHVLQGEGAVVEVVEGVEHLADGLHLGHFGDAEVAQHVHQEVQLGDLQSTSFLFSKRKRSVQSLAGRRGKQGSSSTLSSFVHRAVYRASMN
jgi:hypothetical protein